jgi:hypothetical protein
MDIKKRKRDKEHSIFGFCSQNQDRKILTRTR